MIVVSASGLSKVYGQEVILNNVSFHINQGDRVGIVGRNGAGKTTLINMLTGELNPDSGDFFIAKDKELGYLKQRDNFRMEKSIIQEVSGIFSHLDEMEDEIAKLNVKISEEKDEREQKRLWEKLSFLQNKFEREGGYTYKSEITGVLTAMGFGENTYDLDTGSLSGGERTRLALACLLLKKPDILFLDEPTNHLDIGSLKWLEQYLKNYSGTMVVVSHDRYFLDSLATHIFEVEDREITVYKGNYTEYAEKKRQAREADLRAYNKQQAEIKKQEDLIRRYKERGTEKLAKRALSREKRLSHVERLDKPKGKDASMKIDFHQRFQSGRDVLLGEGLSFGYMGARGTELFRDISFDIKKGEKICIIGDNGTGKTTLLKVIMGNLKPSKGYVKLGHNVEIGYYDQGQMLLNDSSTVIDEIHDEYRLYTDGEIRNILGRFLFRGDDVFKEVGSLSGGEKARLSLLKLMLSGANLLVLDEPTNHLDIESKEAFEEALMDFEGTIVTVSHDRYFLNRIPDRILELNQGELTEFLGKYDYYLEKKRNMESGKEHMKNLMGQQEEQEVQSSSSKDAREEKKRKEALERKRERELSKVMQEIEDGERRITAIEEEMCAPENLTDHEKLRVLSEEMAEIKANLEVLMDRWSELSEE